MENRLATVIELAPNTSPPNTQTSSYGDILQKLAYNTNSQEVAILLSELVQHNDKLDASNTAMRDDIIKSLKQLFQVYQSDSYTKSLIVTDGIDKMIQSLEKSGKMDIGTSTRELVLQLKKYQENAKDHIGNKNAEVGFGLPEVGNMNRMAENIQKKQIIIIGISEHADPKWRLEGTEKDMNNMDSFIGKLGVPVQNITKLSGSNANKENILRIIREKSMNPDGVLIYFAGHSVGGADIKGAEKSDGYILPFDTRRDEKTLIKDSLISGKDILEALGKQQIPPSLIFDSCEAGYIGKQISSSGAKVITASNIELAQDRFVDFVGTSKGGARNASVIELAADIERQYKTKDGGLFTTHLIRQWETKGGLAEGFMSASIILQNRVINGGKVIDQTPTFFDGISDRGKQIRKINGQMPTKAPN